MLQCYTFCNCWASVWLFNCWCLTLCWQTSEEDVSQFDTKFTRQTPVDSPDDSVLSESANQVFVVSVPSMKSQSTFLALYLLSIYWLMTNVIPFTGIYICCPVSSRRAEQTMDIRERTEVSSQNWIKFQSIHEHEVQSYRITSKLMAISITSNFPRL